MIIVIGKDAHGNVVAREKCDTSNDAARVAKQFKDSGLTVEQIRDGNATPA